MLATTLSAAPRVIIRGQSKISIDRVQLGEDGDVAISGRLSDAALDSGLALQRVSVRIELGPRALALIPTRTDDDGVFRIKTPLRRGIHTIGAEFRGNNLFAPSEVAARRFDVSRQALVLALDLPKRLRVGRAGAVARLTAHIGTRPASVPLTISLTGQSSQRLTTDRAGRLEIPLRADKPGSLDLAINFAGDRHTNPTRLERRVFAVTPVKIIASAKRREIAPDGVIRIRAQLSDPSGPIAGGVVALWAHGRHQQSALSNQRGIAQFSVPAASFPPGDLTALLRFTPRVGWREAPEDQPITVTILAPQPVPPRMYALPLLGSLAALSLLVLYRWRPRWSTLRSALHRHPPTPPARQATVRGGIEAGEARWSLIANEYHLGGQLIDASDEQPLNAGQVCLSSPESNRQLDVDTEGKFLVGPLRPGGYRLSAACAGYLAETLDVTVPHRGQLLQISVRLVPIRIRLLEIYKHATQALIERDAWARQTPREVLRANRERLTAQAIDALHELSMLLEIAYWSDQRPIDQRALTIASALANRIAPVA